MKIRITDNRGVFLDGKPHYLDDEITVSKEDGEAAIANGFAVEVTPSKKKAVKK